MKEPIVSLEEKKALDRTHFIWRGLKLIGVVVALVGLLMTLTGGTEGAAIWTRGVLWIVFALFVFALISICLIFTASGIFRGQRKIVGHLARRYAARHASTMKEAGAVSLCVNESEKGGLTMDTTRGALTPSCPKFLEGEGSEKRIYEKSVSA